MQLTLSDITQFSHDLHRPEGAMVARDGTVWAADERGGCARITPDGEHSLVGDLGGMPNGICIDTNGDVIVAKHRQRPSAAAASRRPPRGAGDARRRACSEGTQFSVRRQQGPPLGVPLHRRGAASARDMGTAARRRPSRSSRTAQARLVATEVYFANGFTLDAAEEYLYIAETSAIRIMRFPVRADGTLGPREQYGPHLGDNSYPDGCSFDQAGNLWVTMPFRNAIGVLTPDADWHILLDDPAGTVLPRPSNLCFGGDDLCTAYVGNLEGTTLPSFRTPHPGMPLVHQL